MDLAYYFRNYGEKEFENFCFDEFFIYLKRKINSKNDIIWAKSVDEIPEELCFNKKETNVCQSVFINFIKVINVGD